MNLFDTCQKKKRIFASFFSFFCSILSAFPCNVLTSVLNQHAHSHLHTLSFSRKSHKNYLHNLTLKLVIKYLVLLCAKNVCLDGCHCLLPSDAHYNWLEHFLLEYTKVLSSQVTLFLWPPFSSRTRANFHCVRQYAPWNIQNMGLDRTIIVNYIPAPQIIVNSSRFPAPPKRVSILYISSG